ncbi:MAG: class I SAM-dependent methyltransferase [Chloroflexota bacterium]
MEREQYELMFRQEERHWWYAGMRRITAALLDSTTIQNLAREHAREAGVADILDAGCGSGGTSRFLERWGRVTGVDLMADALTFARERGMSRLIRGSVTDLPFADASFDIVTSFDVLYHLGVSSDARAFSELLRVVRPGGLLLIRLPAYNWLRGAHDVAVHTRHRYTRGELTLKLQDAGFRVEHTTYANSLLFPLAPVKRLLERRGTSAAVQDLWQPPGPINRLLTDLVGAEARIAAGPGLAWGLSIFGLARRVQGWDARADTGIAL